MDSTLHTTDFVVKGIEGRNVFVLDGVRFATLPVELILHRAKSQTSSFTIQRGNSKLVGFALASNEKHVEDPHFVVMPANIRKEDKAKSLDPDRFEEGDILSFDLMPLLRLDLIERVKDQLRNCSDWWQRFRTANTAYEAELRMLEGTTPDPSEDKAELNRSFAAQVDELFGQLQTQVNLPTVLFL